jgi:hypothetical protein
MHHKRHTQTLTKKNRANVFTDCTYMQQYMNAYIQMFDYARALTQARLRADT